MTILEIKDWDKNKCLYSKENSSLEQRIYLHNKMHDFSQNTSKRKEEVLDFSQESPKDKSFQTLSPAIHLEGWGKHFEYECIIKPSKNFIES